MGGLRESYGNKRLAFGNVRLFTGKMKIEVKRNKSSTIKLFMCE